MTRKDAPDVCFHGAVHGKVRVASDESFEIAFETDRRAYRPKVVDRNQGFQDEATELNRQAFVEASYTRLSLGLSGLLLCGTRAG